MCFPQKDTSAHHAKFRKTWNCKYKSVNWWRNVVIIPESAAQQRWTRPSCHSSTGLGEMDLPAEGSALLRLSSEPSGEQLRRSPLLLSPPLLHKSSSQGMVLGWCVKHPKAFLGHTTTALTLEMSAGGRSSWQTPGLCRRACVQSHSRAQIQFCVVMLLLRWITRTDRAAQCSVRRWWQPSGIVREHTFLSMLVQGERDYLTNQAGSGLSSRVAQPLLHGCTAPACCPQVCLQWLPHRLEMNSRWAGGGWAQGAQVRPVCCKSLCWEQWFGKGLGGMAYSHV